jgi:hypothetical protein
MELTATFMELLVVFRPAFTDPSFATFQLLAVGWVLSTRHRYVTDLIITSDSVENGHFSDYHRFFSHAKWDIDVVWRILAGMLIGYFVGSGATVLLAGDDTLCRKRGLGLFGAGMHHDPLSSSRKLKVFSWGHDWVTLCLVVVNPWWAPGSAFALPICMRLYRNRQGVTKGKNKTSGTGKQKKKLSTKRQQKQLKRAERKKRRVATRQRRCRETTKTLGNKHMTRPELMREMLQLVASWFPDRHFLFVGDSLYTGESVLSYLPTNMDMIGAVHSQGALYELPPKKKPGRGRTPKKGKRLPTRDQWAANSSRWTAISFDQFGLHGTFETKMRIGLYYRAGKDRPLKFVLTRDTDGQRPTQIFYCTNLDLEAQEILSTYANRWAIEVTHHDAKQFLGLEDPANRVPLAVHRTAPTAMILYSLTVLWYAQHGHTQVQFPHRPWYPQKSRPSFADMLTTLRRTSWENELFAVRKTPTLWERAVRRLAFVASLAG